MQSSNRVLPNIWVDRNGRILHLKEMHDNHILNAINLLKKRGFIEEYKDPLSRMASVQLEALIDEAERRGLEV